MDKDQLLSLISKKDELEKQIIEKENIIKELDAKQLDKNLIDEEGFPRADLDFGELSNFRNLKKNIRELKNDHVQLMKEIEKGLYGLHDYYRQSGEAQKELEEYEASLPNKPNSQNQEPMQQSEPQEEQKQEMLMPFAEINEVTQESPSSTAGIKVNDLIVEFGSINYYNNDNLGQLAQFVKSSENNDVQIILLRNVEPIEKDAYQFQGKPYKKIVLVLRPQRWNGIGLLGCRFKIIAK